MVTTETKKKSIRFWNFDRHEIVASKLAQKYIWIWLNPNNMRVKHVHNKYTRVPPPFKMIKISYNVCTDGIEVNEFENFTVRGRSSQWNWLKKNYILLVLTMFSIFLFCIFFLIFIYSVSVHFTMKLHAVSFDSTCLHWNKWNVTFLGEIDSYSFNRM